jgi:DnaJ like chaperone protein
MFFIVLGALIGAAMGGVPGALLGGSLGYLAGLALRRFLIGGLRVTQSQLIDSTFAVMGALCKADSVVTRDEIKAVERMFSMLKLEGAQREQAKDQGRRADVFHAQARGRPA